MTCPARPRIGPALGALLAAGALWAAPAAAEPFRVGFIYQGPRVDAGWYQSQDEGRAYLQKALPEVQVIVAENVPENADAERVMERMARSGARVIFATSFGYFDKAVRVAQRYPDVVFMHSGDGQIGYHVGNYYGSTEQTMYVAGVAAGLKTTTNKLGYVAAHPLPTLLRSLNSFARGARSVNPKATLQVIFLDSWKDPVREAEAANSLIDQGVDVLAQEVDSNLTMAQVAESRGISFVGQYFDAHAIAPHAWLVGNYYYWGPLMVDIVHQVQAGTWTAHPILATLAGGELRMTPGGPGVTPAAQARINEALADFTERGRQLWAGPIRGQDGSILVAAGEVLPAARLTNMNFFVEGVVGSLPR